MSADCEVRSAECELKSKEQIRNPQFEFRNSLLPGDHVVASIGASAPVVARVLCAYSLTWNVASRPARTIELVTVRVGREALTVDASQVRSLSSPHARYATPSLAWTRTWKPRCTQREDGA